MSTYTANCLMWLRYNVYGTVHTGVYLHRLVPNEAMVCLPTSVHVYRLACLLYDVYGTLINGATCPYLL